MAKGKALHKFCDAQRGCVLTINYHLSTILFFLIVHSSLFTFAQTAATLKSDSTHFEIGDPLQLKLVVTTPSGNAVNFPKFEGDSFGKIEILSKSKIDTAKLNNKIVLSQSLNVTAYDSGEFTIAPFAVHYYNTAEKRDDSILTNELMLQSKTLDVDTAKPFKAIKAPLEIPYEWREFLPWIIGGITGIALLLAGFFLYRYYKKRKPQLLTRPRPKDPAHIWAQRELKKLEQEKLWQSDAKQYHSRLTDILRSYLEYRFDYYALESTTEEIAIEIEKLKISMDASPRLMETLRLADFVKFAKLNPAPDEHSKSMQNAFAFVDMTKPLPEEIISTQQKQNPKKKKRK